jgi:hypothetical protein
VLLDVFGADPKFGPPSAEALRECLARGSLIVCEVVVAEVASAFAGEAAARSALERLGARFSAMDLASSLPWGCASGRRASCGASCTAFDPAPYTACQRRPASRYLYTTFPSGFIPFLNRPPEVEAAQVAPGSQEILLRELTESKPAIIFDSAMSMNSRSMLQYEPFARFVRARYCRSNANVGGSTPWVKKAGDECPAQ